MRFVSTYNASFSPTIPLVSGYPVSERIARKQPLLKRPGPLLPTPVLPTTTLFNPNLNGNSNVIPPPSRTTTRTLVTLTSNRTSRQYLLDKQLEDQMEKIDFSLLGKVSEEVKHSFECWLWQKE